MKLQMVGCSHHTAPAEVRERLAFSKDQAIDALSRLRLKYPSVDVVDEYRAFAIGSRARLELFQPQVIRHNDVVRKVRRPPLDEFKQRGRD